jgi:curved DNA-binding protein CbpA
MQQNLTHFLFCSDANPHTDTTAQFQMINRAYQVLSDPLERKKYDVRMQYTNDNPHFIISDMEDGSLRRQREQYEEYQQSPFGNLSNDKKGAWQVSSSGRMFLMDNENDGTLFR